MIFSEKQSIYPFFFNFGLLKELNNLRIHEEKSRSIKDE